MRVAVVLILVVLATCYVTTGACLFGILSRNVARLRMQMLEDRFPGLMNEIRPGNQQGGQNNGYQNNNQGSPNQNGNSNQGYPNQNGNSNQGFPNNNQGSQGNNQGVPNNNNNPANNGNSNLPNSQNQVSPNGFVPGSNVG